RNLNLGPPPAHILKETIGSIPKGHIYLVIFDDDRQGPDFTRLGSPGKGIQVAGRGAVLFLFRK
ncbi:MAG: hypothetical protein KDA42_16650, partial [Planctomycetales bacterium]|nr:hypothetical protein [Planctomycetales bacterium]